MTENKITRMNLMIEMDNETYTVDLSDIDPDDLMRAIAMLQGKTLAKITKVKDIYEWGFLNMLLWKTIDMKTRGHKSCK